MSDLGIQATTPFIDPRRFRAWYPIDESFTVEDLIQAKKRSFGLDGIRDGVPIDFTTCYASAPPEVRSAYDVFTANKEERGEEATRPSWNPPNGPLTLEDLIQAKRRSLEPDGAPIDFTTLYASAPLEVRSAYDVFIANEIRKADEQRRAEQAARRAWHRNPITPQETRPIEPGEITTTVTITEEGFYANPFAANMRELFEARMRLLEELEPSRNGNEMIRISTNRDLMNFMDPLSSPRNRRGAVGEQTPIARALEVATRLLSGRTITIINDGADRNQNNILDKNELDRFFIKPILNNKTINNIPLSDDAFDFHNTL